MTGGFGHDAFLFSAALNGTTNLESITDFSIVRDTMRLENAFFNVLNTIGVLTAGAFVANTTGFAAQANDRIVYEAYTGKRRC